MIALHKYLYGIFQQVERSSVKEPFDTKMRENT